MAYPNYLIYRRGGDGKVAECVCLIAHVVLRLPPFDMSFSDFYASDLTDLTSSSDQEESSLTNLKTQKQKPKKTKPDQRPAYTVSNTLRPPRSTNYSVRSLYGNLSFLFLFFFSLLFFSEQIIDGTINLDPDYQRGITSVFSVNHQHDDMPS